MEKPGNDFVLIGQKTVRTEGTEEPEGPAFGIVEPSAAAAITGDSLATSSPPLYVHSFRLFEIFIHYLVICATSAVIVFGIDVPICMIMRHVPWRIMELSRFSGRYFPDIPLFEVYKYAHDSPVSTKNWTVGTTAAVTPVVQ